MPEPLYWKFLDPSGCTYYLSKPFRYNLPRRDEKWARTDHPEPGEPDGKACGPGGLHLRKQLNSQYAPHNWWPWAARNVGVTLGENAEKVRATAVELRHVTKKVFWRCLRPPFNWGKGSNLHGANLSGANLSGADLSGAMTEGAIGLNDLRSKS